MNDVGQLTLERDVQNSEILQKKKKKDFSYITTMQNYGRTILINMSSLLLTLMSTNTFIIDNS